MLVISKSPLKSFILSAFVVKYFLGFCCFIQGLCKRYDRQKKVTQKNSFTKNFKEQADVTHVY